MKLEYDIPATATGCGKLRIINEEEGSFVEVSVYAESDKTKLNLWFKELKEEKENGNS